MRTYTPSKLAADLIKEKTVDGVCTLSKKKLGEILFLRHPDVFVSAEDGRSKVRLVTGAHGEQLRREVKNIVEWNGFKLPEPEKNDYSKVIVKAKRVGILSDIHLPYYDKEALTVAIKYLLTKDPDCIILNGDTIDFYQLSNFERDPRKRSPKYEIDMLKNLIRQIRDLFPRARVIYKEGNHCERYEKKILNRLPELIDLELFTLDTVIEAKVIGVEMVKNKRLIKLGHLNVGHGHEFSRGFVAPVNPARGFYLKAKSNFIGGHHHRTSEHLEQDINGKIIGAWSTGCLCELNPHYMPINSWNHGFAFVEVDGNDFSVHNHKVIKGKVT